SNPTRLIEIVEVGKQLLITRGALTTFSIANDVAKYFAIIPAVFVATYPQLQALNIMRLATPHSAVLSAVIFNALIIVALIPLALRGVRYRPLGAATLLRRNLLLYGVGGIILPFIGIKLIDLMLVALHLTARCRLPESERYPMLHMRSPQTPLTLAQDGADDAARPIESGRRAALRQFRPAILLTLLLTLIVGVIYPLVVTGAAQALFPAQANGSLVYVNGKPIGSSLIGQYWTQPQYFHGRPSATVNLQGTPAPYEADNSGASNLGPTNANLIK